MLVDAGLISEAQLRGALGRQKQWGGRLGTNLVKLGNLKEDDLGRFLATQTGVREMNISNIQILPHILKMVPKKIAEKYYLIPIAMKDKNTLIVSFADPTDLGAIDHVSFITGHKVEPVISTYDSIRRAIDKFYPGATTLTGDESIALSDDTSPSMVAMGDMTGHGGHSASDDPDLIIFGNQEENNLDKASRPPDRKPAPKKHQFVREPPPQGPAGLDPANLEFTLDFNPDWATGTGMPLVQEKPPSGKPRLNAEQKLKVLMRVLIKKGLITEADLRREMAYLQSKGKL
jgi:type IV pilus assembly protein PilB